MPEKKEWGKPKEDTSKRLYGLKSGTEVGRHERLDAEGAAALFKQGDKEFAKESNKKHTNKGSAGVRKGYNPNTNACDAVKKRVRDRAFRTAIRKVRDEETGELSKKQEIRHDDLDNSLMDEDYYKFKSTSSKP